MEELSDWHSPVRLEDTLGEVDTEIIEVNIIGEMMEIIVIDEVTMQVFAVSFLKFKFST